MGRRILSGAALLIVLSFGILPAWLDRTKAAPRAASSIDRVVPNPGSRWQRSIPLALNESEYEFRTTAKVGWSAPNRAHGLRVMVRDEGVEVTPRIDGSTWSLTMFVESVGREGVARKVGVPIRKIEMNRAEFRFTDAGLTEWYINRPAGLEHGFTIEAAPRFAGGSGDLLVEIAARGLRAVSGTPGAGNIRFLTQTGDAVLEYGALEVFDTTGRKLRSRLSSRGAGLQIRI